MNITLEKLQAFCPELTISGKTYPVLWEAKTMEQEIKWRGMKYRNGLPCTDEIYYHASCALPKENNNAIEFSISNALSDKFEFNDPQTFFPAVLRVQLFPEMRAQYSFSETLLIKLFDAMAALKAAKLLKVFSLVTHSDAPVKPIVEPVRNILLLK
jgi:hypothetical protein